MLFKSDLGALEDETDDFLGGSAFVGAFALAVAKCLKVPASILRRRAFVGRAETAAQRVVRHWFEVEELFVDVQQHLVAVLAITHSVGDVDDRAVGAAELLRNFEFGAASEFKREDSSPFCGKRLEMLAPVANECAVARQR
jgi:hypothetical protein